MVIILFIRKIVFKVYGENYDKYENLKKQYEREDFVKVNDRGLPKSSTMSERPGTMRAWINKWDPEFNTEFKQVGSQTDTSNN